MAEQDLDDQGMKAVIYTLAYTDYMKQKLEREEAEKARGWQEEAPKCEKVKLTLQPLWAGSMEPKEVLAKAALLQALNPDFPKNENVFVAIQKMPSMEQEELARLWEMILGSVKMKMTRRLWEQSRQPEDRLQMAEFGPIYRASGLAGCTLNTKEEQELRLFAMEMEQELTEIFTTLLAYLESFLKRRDLYASRASKNTAVPVHSRGMINRAMNFIIRKAMDAVGQYAEKLPEILARTAGSGPLKSGL